MNKILYISDLDGTLLDGSAQITAESAGLLNDFIASGGSFSVATARTAATAVIITRNVNINVPVVLMNGVCVYDIASDEYVKIEQIPDDSLCSMLKVLKNFRLSGFMFSVRGNILDTYYENTDSENARKFVEERTKKFGKVFTKVSSFEECTERGIIYYSVTDTNTVLDPVYSALREIKGIHIDYYRDVYDERFWYLEVSSAAASKYNAVMFLREKYGFDRVVGFGDNFNDLPLFDACDETYAVSNAREEVKKRADGVIPPNTENGVARKICGLL